MVYYWDKNLTQKLDVLVFEENPAMAAKNVGHYSAFPYVLPKNQSQFYETRKPRRTQRMQYSRYSRNNCTFY